MEISNNVQYPSAAEMWSRWGDLLSKISVSHSSPVLTKEKGELTIIGSGISFVDFTADSKSEILSADYVFYCLYDRLSQVWLSTIRPDAFDLYVLYNDDTKRYYTYIQMAEAMLYYVRRGKKVVAIYYGHPGVFATPTHRAIQIARREGHRARMRPGISALDYLIAEVGFDPAIPGMVNYEATDMLLRNRKIDRSLHVVIWQVGLVGDFGFSRAGFKNDGFKYLVKELISVYGREWHITHYVASRFVGIDPLIEELTIGELENHEITKNISALSTFYIPPFTALPTDLRAGRELGLLSRNDPVPTPFRTPDIAQYDSAALSAIRQMSDVTLPKQYKIPKLSPEAEFVFDLSQNFELQAEYRRDPIQTLSKERYGILTDRARALLAIPNPIAIDKALFEAD